MKIFYNYFNLTVRKKRNKRYNENRQRRKRRKVLAMSAGHQQPHIVKALDAIGVKYGKVFNIISVQIQSHSFIYLLVYYCRVFYDILF